MPCRRKLMELAMAFRNMSRNEALGDPATHFFKSGNILRAKENSDLTQLVSMFPNYKIEYDIWYSKDDAEKVHGFVYTDVANKLLYVRVGDKQRSLDIMQRAAKHELTPDGEAAFSELAGGSDKYLGTRLRAKHDFVIFLPGGNIFNDVVRREKLMNAVQQGAKLKLHPITARNLQALLEKTFGTDALIDRRVSAHQLLKDAKIVGAFTNSEMGLVATAQGKRVHLFNDLDRMCTYTAIYKAISDGDELSADKLKRVLSDKSSGLISPVVTDPQEFIDGFFNQFEGQHV